MPPKRRLARRELERCPLGVASQILSRISDINKRLLHMAPAGGIYDERVRIALREHVWLHTLLAGNFSDEHRIVRAHNELAVLTQHLEFAVTPNVVTYIRDDVWRQVILAELPEHVQHTRRVESRRRRVPEREGRQAVRVNVLWRLLQLRKLGKRIASFGVERVVYLQQERAVTLYDKWIAWLYRHGGSRPIWKIGVKSSITRRASLPTFRYI